MENYRKCFYCGYHYHKRNGTAHKAQCHRLKLEKIKAQRAQAQTEATTAMLADDDMIDKESDENSNNEVIHVTTEGDDTDNIWPKVYNFTQEPATLSPNDKWSIRISTLLEKLGVPRDGHNLVIDCFNEILNEASPRFDSTRNNQITLQNKDTYTGKLTNSV
ncbi:hypothetical protein BC941DRAFT_466164 [Chlamydoabsidia padenii]|nr:hypothetical protein BC941DRAFT_466164 [Chlamydoabsidia padenii]